MSAVTALSPDLPSFGALHVGTILSEGWREPIDLPARPALVFPSPAIVRPRARAADECRELALALSRNRDRLNGWDRTLVGEVVRWRAEPSLFEVDEIAALAERLYWRARDGEPLLRRGRQ